MCIDTVGLIPAFRGRGIYRAFLKQLIAYLDALGYERLTTSHHPDNRAVMIPELKAGFHIVGIKLHENCGSRWPTCFTTTAGRDFAGCSAWLQKEYRMDGICRMDRIGLERQ